MLILRINRNFQTIGGCTATLALLCGILLLMSAACPMENPMQPDPMRIVVNDQSFTAAENISSGTVIDRVQATIPQGTSPEFTITTNSPATGTGLFAIDPTTGDLRLASGQSLDFETATSHSITVQVSNGTASASATITITVTDAPDNPPELTNQTAVSVEQGAAITPIRFASSLGTIVSCSASMNLPSGLSASLVNQACEISGTVPISETTGATTVTVTATNNDGTGSATVDITITLAAPIIGNQTAVTVARDETISPITFTNTGGAISMCSASMNLPAGLSATEMGGNCEIRGTVGATATVGTVTVTVTATNARGTGTATVNFTVNTAAIVGDATMNTLNGTDDGELIQGLGEADTLNGNGGNDILEGGEGDDMINGGAGDDTALFNEAGTFTFTAGTGNVRVDHTPSMGRTALGMDTVNSDVETVELSSGNDTVTSFGIANINVDAGDGFDTLSILDSYNLILNISDSPVARATVPKINPGTATISNSMLFVQVNLGIISNFEQYNINSSEVSVLGLTERSEIISNRGTGAVIITGNGGDDRIIARSGSRYAIVDFSNSAGNNDRIDLSVNHDTVTLSMLSFTRAMSGIREDINLGVIEGGTDNDDLSINLTADSASLAILDDVFESGGLLEAFASEDDLDAAIKESFRSTDADSLDCADFFIFGEAVRATACQ